MYTQTEPTWKWHGRFILSLIMLGLIALFVTQRPASSQSSAILWQGDAEEGTMYDWDFGDQSNAGGGIFNDVEEDVLTEASTDVARSGNYSYKTRITNAYRGENGKRAVRLMRWTDKPWNQGGQIFPDDTYYSTWMYVPMTYNSNKYDSWRAEGGWWNIFQFKSKDSSGTSQPIWTVNLDHNDDTDEMVLTLYSKYNQPNSRTQANPIPIPVGEWVHLEARLVNSSDGAADGLLTFWQNGVKIFDERNQVTTIDERNIWGIGNYTDHVSGEQNEGSATLYFDDAIVSTEAIHPYLSFEPQPQPTNTPAPQPTQIPAPTATPQPSPGESTVLFTFEDGIGGWRTYNKSNSAIDISTTSGDGSNNALQVWYDVPSDGYAAAYTDNLSTRDWRDYESIQFAFHGQGTGDEIRFQIYDNGREIFEVKFDDNASGWQTRIFPLDAFTRASWQPSGAPNNGLTLSDVQRIVFKIDKDNRSINTVFRVDDVTLNAAPQVSADVLFDFSDNPTWETYQKSNSAISASASGGQLTVDYDVPSNGYAAALTDDLSSRDWRDYSAVQFEFNGRNTGDELTFEIYDNGNEIFQARFDDDVNGWQTITLPISTFTRASWQPSGAPNNGLTLSDVQRITFKIDKDNTNINSMFDVDDIVLVD